MRFLDSSPKYPNLTIYAKHLGISYQTAWRWWKANKLPHPAKQTETGTVIVDFNPKLESLVQDNKVVIYARVSFSENKDNLDRQAERLIQYATVKGRLKVKLEIVNLADNCQDELMQDLVAIITSFAARLSGQRRGKRKTERIIQELNNKENAIS